MEEIYGCNLINTKHDRRDVTEFVGKYHIHVLVRQGQMSFSDGKNSFTSRQGDLAIWQMSNTIQCIECSEDFEADVLLLSWQFLQQFNPEMVWASKGFVFIRINPSIHHDMMLDEEVVGGDETTENINGVLKWLWTWRSERLTYLAGGKGRGPKDFDSEYPDGFPKSTFVSDRLPLYYNVVAQGHQICIAHLLRNLIYLDQLDPMQDWSKRMQELLRDAIRQRKHIDWVDIDRADIVKRFEKLLDEPLDKLDIEFRRLQNSLRKWKDAVFTFLYNKKVPSDNNGSEREVRKAKIKMKVSQCFRSFKGAEAFDVLHSLMDTAKKNGQSAFNVIRAIAYPKAIADGVYLQF